MNKPRANCCSEA